MSPPFPLVLKDGEKKTFPLSNRVIGAITGNNIRVRIFAYDGEGKIHKNFIVRHHDPKRGEFIKQKVRTK